LATREDLTDLIELVRGKFGSGFYRIMEHKEGKARLFCEFDFGSDGKPHITSTRIRGLGLFQTDSSIADKEKEPVHESPTKPYGTYKEGWLDGVAFAVGELRQIVTATEKIDQYTDEGDE